MAFGTISQMIQDILQRQPTPGEIADYQARLDNGSLTQAGLANELIDGIAGKEEALDVVFPVLRFYQGVYGRVPDKGGLAYWVGVYREIYSLDNPETPTQNEALVALAVPFVDPVLTPEFLQRYGAPPTSYDGAEWQTYATNFIDKLYLNVLQRQADTGGLEYWTGEFLAKFAELRTKVLLEGGTEAQAALLARAIYLEQFTNSQEMKDATASSIRAFLTGAAQDPDPANLYTGSAVNDPPVANPDSYDGVEDQILVIPVGSGVLANDIDPDYGQTLTASIVDNPSVGSVSFNANGSFSYTPAANYNGTVTFTYRADDGLVLSAPTTVTMTIGSVFDPPVYSIAVSPSSATEGNIGAGATITYTISRAGDLNVPGSVLVAFSGTATQGLDYTVSGLTGGAAAFAAGASIATVIVTTTPDTTVEPNETVIATLGTITGGGTLGANTMATATITNDDTGTGVPVYDIAVTPSSVVEGDSGQGNAITYTISRIGDLSQTGTVGVSLTGSATFGTDYTSTVSGGVLVFVPGEGPTLSPNGGSVSFASGQSQASFTVTTTPDTAFEPNETVIASLASISGTGTFGTANSATATITNDDTAAAGPVYAVAVTPSSVVEGSGGIGNTITYTVTRTGDVSQAGSVAVSLSGTANGSDYYTTSLSGGVISFAPNESQLDFTVTTQPDRTVEPNETVIATLGTITGGGTIETLGSATATITNDDTIEYSIAVSTSSVTEGNTGPGATITYTASRTGNLSTSDVISIFYQGTANGLDYDASETHFVSWDAGASTTTWTVTVLPDTQVEPNETITVLINGGNYGGVGPANSVTTTIVNDDADPTGTVYTIEASPSSVAEGSGGTGNTITYTVARTGDFTSPGSVAVTLGGTATLDLDYTSSLSGGVVSFAYGEDRKSFTITTTPDLGSELNETVRASLGAITGGGTLGATSSATTTITNDDADFLNTFYSISVSPSSVTEGNSGPGSVIAYTITRTGDTSEAGAVNVILQGTASSQVDYSLPFFGSVVRFAAGQTEFIYNLTVKPDTTSESDETVTVSLDSFPHGAQLSEPYSATAVILNDDPVSSALLIGVIDNHYAWA